MITPTNTPISNPPTAASTPTASPGSGAFCASARATTSILRAWVASSIPVPRPVTRSARKPVIAAVMALAAVVLPMPISPIPTSVDAVALELIRDAEPDPRSTGAPHPATSPGRPSCRPCRHGWAEPGRPGRAGRRRPGCRPRRRRRPRSRSHRRRPGEHIDRRPAGQEVGDHLWRDVGRVGGDALPYDAMVGGGDHDGAPLERSARIAGDAGKLDRQRLRAGRDCQAAWSARRGRADVAAIAAVVERRRARRHARSRRRVPLPSSVMAVPSA